MNINADDGANSDDVKLFSASAEYTRAKADFLYKWTLPFAELMLAKAKKLYVAEYNKALHEVPDIEKLVRSQGWRSIEDYAEYIADLSCGTAVKEAASFVQELGGEQQWELLITIPEIERQ